VYDYLPVVENEGFPAGNVSQKPETKPSRSKSQGYPCSAAEPDLNNVQCLFISAAIKHKAPVMTSYGMVVTATNNLYKVIELVQKA